MTREDYLEWEARLGFDGRPERAAAALGVSIDSIAALRAGTGDYESRTLTLAMAAVAAGIPAWPERLLRAVGPEDEDRRVKPGEGGANDD